MDKCFITQDFWKESTAIGGPRHGEVCALRRRKQAHRFCNAYNMILRRAGSGEIAHWREVARLTAAMGTAPAILPRAFFVDAVEAADDFMEGWVRRRRFERVREEARISYRNILHGMHSYRFYGKDGAWPALFMDVRAADWALRWMSPHIDERGRVCMSAHARRFLLALTGDQMALDAPRLS